MDRCLQVRSRMGRQLGQMMTCAKKPSSSSSTSIGLRVRTLCHAPFLSAWNQATVRAGGQAGAHGCVLTSGLPSCCRIPASQLATPSHVEVQIVFKGQMAEGHEQWDNNEGNNWQVRLDQTHTARTAGP